MKKILTLSILALAGGMVASGVQANESKQVKASTGELNYVSKSLSNNALQVNTVNAASSRFTFNILMPATIDHPASSVLRTAYYTTGGGSMVKDLKTSGSTTDAEICARIYSLNLFKGNLLMDGEPISDVNDSTKTHFWETSTANHGRIVMTRNADNTTETPEGKKQCRLKLGIDLYIPNYKVGFHTFTIKKGTEFPSWAFALNETVGSTTADTVYKTAETMSWALYTNGTNNFADPANCAKAKTAVEPVLADKFAFSQESFRIMNVRGAATTGFVLGVFSPYNRCLATEDPHGYFNNRGKDYGSMHLFGKENNWTNHPNVTQLYNWERFEVNGISGTAFLNGGTSPDSRFAQNGLVLNSTGGQLQDGRQYGRPIQFELATSALYGDNSQDKTITFKFKKGFQLPTIEALASKDVGSYLELDADYEIVLFHAAGAGNASYTVKSFTRVQEALPNDEETEVLGMNLVKGDDDDTFGTFRLSNYDNKTSTTQFNQKMLIWTDKFNIRDNVLINSGDGSTPTTNLFNISNSHGRRERIRVSPSGVGYVMPFKSSAIPFDKITIKAGTRFPAYSYLTNGGATYNADMTPQTQFEKYYVTTKDVTLTRNGDRWLSDSTQEVITKQVTPTALKVFQNSGTTSMKLCVSLDGATYDRTIAVNSVLRKTDNIWTGIEIDGTPIISRWEGDPGDLSGRSTRNEVVKDSSNVYYHAMQMKGNYEDPQFDTVTIPQGTKFYSLGYFDGQGVAEVYVVKADTTFIKTVNGTTFAEINAVRKAMKDEVDAGRAQLVEADYTDEINSALDAFVATAKTTIDGTSKYADMEKALNTAKAAFKSVAEVDDRIAEIIEYRQNLNADDYGQYENALLDKIAKDASESFKTFEDIINATEIVAKAKGDMDAVETLAEQAAALAARKEEMVTYLTAFKTAEGYRDAELTQIASIVDLAIQKVNAETTIVGVDAQVTKAEAEIKALVSDEMYELAELQAAKALYMGKLDNYLAERASDTTIYHDELVLAVGEIRNAIVAAETVTAVENAYAALAQLNVPNDVQAVAIYAQSAATYLVQYVNSLSASNYEAADQSAIIAIATNAMTQLQSVASMTEVDNIMNAAIAAINNVPTKAERAADALAAAKVQAVNSLKALEGGEEAHTTNRAAFLNAVDEGEKAINAAKDMAALNAAFEEASKNVKMINNDTEAAAAAAAVDALVNAVGTLEYTEECEAKVEAIAEAYAALTAKEKDLVTTDVEKVLTDFAEYKEADVAVKAIENIGEVEYRVLCKHRIDDARKAYDALSEGAKAKVSEETLKVLTDAEALYADLEADASNVGCKGSIVAASGIVTLVTLLGAGLICAKRKED